MFKSLKAPDKLFGAAMWVVSLAFAGFLIGLGGKLIADLPQVEAAAPLEQFANPAQLQAWRDDIRATEQRLAPLRKPLEDAQAELARRSSAHQAALDAQQAWLATRRATASNPGAAAQDPELLRRNAEIEALAAQRRQAQLALEQLAEQRRLLQQHIATQQQAVDQALAQAQPAFEQAQRRRELKVFGARLALTLPILAVAVWLFVTQRRSPHWPLLRGYIVFALFAFFVELVPYLPSYGGYVRYVVGIVLCVAGGHYGIRWMQAYLARRRDDEQRSERERRATLDRDAAVQRMAAGLCPGCERPMLSPAGAAGAEVNHCVYCGLRLFDHCAQPVADSAPAAAEDGAGAPTRRCGVRKNAFFLHCPTCGGATAAGPAPAVQA